jgi:soluble lytic murein transglycosylase
MRKKDGPRLAALRVAAVEEKQPLALWVDYWELSGRITTAGSDEIEAFYQRWPGTYVEDRLRNDWLLELGRRREWKALAADYPRFRMNDDREVTCYALLADQLAGKRAQRARRRGWRKKIMMKAARRWPRNWSRPSSSAAPICGAGRGWRWRPTAHVWPAKP